MLDRLLTYRWHLERLRKKLTSHIELSRQLSSSGGDAGAATLRIATLVKVLSTSEYSAVVWCRSAHTRLIDPTFNNTLRIFTGCLHPTPADNLPIHTSNQPAELCRNGATLSLARHAIEPGQLLHSVLTSPSSADAQRLKSRHPFVPATQHLICSSENIRVAHWADHQSNAELADSPTWVHIFIPDTSTHPPGMTLPRRAWVNLTTSAPASGVSTHVCTNRVWPSQWPVVSGGQKNKPSSMSYIDIPMDCTAWRFWMMRQSNGCSTPAVRSCAAKQWLEQQAQKKNPSFSVDCMYQLAFTL